MVGAALLAVIVLIALLAPLLAPYDPYAQDLTRRLIPPIWYEKGTWEHPLGTDNLGRDYLSRVIYGARISLAHRRFGDADLRPHRHDARPSRRLFRRQRSTWPSPSSITTRLAMPVILVALAVVAMLGGSLLVVILVLGLLKWDRFAVVMRSATQQMRSLDYVAAAEADRRLDGAHRARRGAAERRCRTLIVVATRRGGERDPARGGAVVPRARRAAAAALLGPDDRRGQGLHVLLVLADRHPGHGAGAARASRSTWSATALRDVAAPGRDAAESAPLLEVEDLARRHRRPPRGTLHAVRDVSFDGRARRDPLPRRRIRLRQVDDGARADGSRCRAARERRARRLSFEGEDLAEAAAIAKRCAATGSR